jgi:hypothetical protein
VIAGGGRITKVRKASTTASHILQWAVFRPDQRLVPPPASPPRTVSIKLEIRSLLTATED